MTKELTNKIVLLGDSLTEYWNWADLGPELEAVNQGIGGDTSMGLLSRVRHATVLRPQVISLQVGINDLSQGIAPAEIADNHFAIWREINRNSPMTHLIVCSLMPIRRAKLAWASETLHGERVRETNLRLKKALDGILSDREIGPDFKGRLSWLDLHRLTADPGGDLPDEMTDDGVHLTWKAYRVWTAALKGHLDEVVRARAAT